MINIRINLCPKPSHSSSENSMLLENAIIKKIKHEQTFSRKLAPDKVFSNKI